jgi:serine/threonine protein kinase
VAPEERRGPFLERSLLVTEYIEGPSLAEAWGRDASACAAFPRFLAALHRRGIFHGDLHPGNLLWNGTEWVLIDLAALRHPLRTLRRRRLILDQWAELALRLEPDARLSTAFEAYLGAAGLAWERGRTWERVLERARRAAR